MKILVADDSRVMRQIVIRTLRQAGYDGHTVVEAQDGRDALEKVAAEQPDLVLSDWNMPEMNGIDCLRALRSSRARLHTKLETPFYSGIRKTVADIVTGLP